MSEALKSKSNPLSGKLVPILIVILIVSSFFIGSLYTKVQILQKGDVTGVGTQADATASSSQPALNVDIKNVDIKGEPFIGEEKAPVTLAYWFDFQCPFCKMFEEDALTTIIEKYVNTGKLKVVFKDFQFLGPDSQTAGLAEHAVWEVSPQNYLRWQQAMYKSQDAENAGWGNKDDIIALTKTISGIDADRVSQLMESKKDEYQKEQDDDRAEGGKFNINGTPGFVIGRQNISGAQPANVFTQIIDSELAK